jgi:hypothetical protein
MPSSHVFQNAALLEPPANLVFCGDSRHPLHVTGCTKEHQDASSQVMDKITGTESSVDAKIVSRAKITPRS